MDSENTDRAPLLLTDEAIAAIRKRADQHAELLVKHLEECGVPPADFQAPKAFLLEVAAILQLRLWEENGLHRFLGGDLPTYSEAWDLLLTRTSKGNAEFQGDNASPIAERVLNAFVNHCAWDSDELLGGDIVIDCADDDAVIEEVARFIANHMRAIRESFD